MSMSTHVIGFAPPDEQWEKMKAVWDACRLAKVPVPPDVEKFFNYEAPDDEGVKIELPIREWRDDSAQGFEIDVDSIPKHVKTIRFFNSWLCFRRPDDERYKAGRSDQAERRAHDCRQRRERASFWALNQR